MPEPGGDARPPLVLKARPALSPAVLVAVCGVLAAAVLAAAAGATHGTPSGAGHAAAWADRVAVDVIAAVEVLMVVAIVAAVLLVIISGGIRPGLEHRAADRRRRSWWKQLLVFGACVALALALAHSTPRSHDRAVPPAPAPLAPPSTLPATHQQLPSPDWWLVITLLGLAGVGVLLAGWQTSTRRQRRPGSTGPRAAGADDSAADSLGSAVRAGLRDLSSETDPRRAVILSYGAMESSLAQAGYARRRSEAPMEYLARILRDGGVSPDAITELTDLFERAGFSPRPVDEGKRIAAGDALRRVETELAARARANEPAGQTTP